MKRNGAVALTGILFFVFISVFSDDFIHGIKAGLVNCAEILIPSLFPFILASSVSAYGRLPLRAKKFLDPVSDFLFGLPSETLPAIILGQAGGYLSGASTIRTLLLNKTINENDAERVLLFSVNAGVGFSVNAVGNALLDSRQAGKVIFASLCISSLIMGIILRFFKSDTVSAVSAKKNNISFSEALVNGVSSSATATLTSCAFVLIFSGILSVINTHIGTGTAVTAISCLLEITNGCISLAGNTSLPVIAAACAFGGLCVHMQIFFVSQPLKLNLFRFYLFRLVHSISAFLICNLILLVFPVHVSASVCLSENIGIFSFSAPAAISLLFLCALLILDLDNNKEIC